MDGLTRDGNRAAGTFDQTGVGVAKEYPKGRVGVGRTIGSGGGIDPGNRLPIDGVGMVIPNRPVKEVLERSREASRVLGCGEENRIRGVDHCAEPSDGGVEWRLVAIWVEGWEST